MPPQAEGFASRLVLGPALRTQPDRRLVTLVREGYEAAFEEIIRRYGKPLGRYAASIVGNRSEDVTQDAFSKALLALQRSEREVELRPWLFRIVRNTALNDLRDSPPSPEVLAEAIAGGANPAEELERREELADLMLRLQALPEPQRAAIVMRELEGLSHEEIAAALGLSGGAARQTIYRARQALRDGAGMLIPLPLLQAMLAGGGAGVAETAATGMSVAGVGGAVGVGGALKATAATVLIAGAAGAGVALEDNPTSGDAKAAPARVSNGNANQAAAVAGQGTSFSQEESARAGDADRHGRGSNEAEAGDDRGGELQLVDDHRGHGSGDDAEPGGDRGGHDSSPGRHGGSSGPSGDDRSDSSGSADHDGNSGHSGSSDSSHGGPGPGDVSGAGGDSSGSSGSGHGGGSGESPSGGGPGPSEEPALDDHSGSSGSGSDGSSGPGSGSGSSGGGDPTESPS